MRTFEKRPPATSKYPMRFAPAEHEPQVDHVRGFPNAYELDDDGLVHSTHPPANLAPGELMRGAMPVHVFKPIVPVYDPTMIEHPEYWAGTR